MQVSCVRCKGTGKIPEYSWNKGGVCFTCGGDGKLNPLSEQKLQKHEKDMSQFLKNVSTRDLTGTLKEMDRNAWMKLGESSQSAIRRDLKDRAERLGVENNALIHLLIPKLEEALDKKEKEIPQPWKKGANARNTEEVPVHWLTKFQGNSLRRDKAEMTEFSKKLVKEGLEDPVMIVIGQEDRKVSIGEGNHRTFAFLEAGLDKVPARVVRQRTNPGGVFYDEMDNIAQFDYVKADLKPSEVFNTYYDGNVVSEYDEKSIQKLGHQKIETELPKNMFWEGNYRGESGHVKEYYTNRGQKLSKHEDKAMSSLLEEAKTYGMSKEDIERLIQSEIEWIDIKQGIVQMDTESFIDKLSGEVDTAREFYEDDNGTSSTSYDDDDIDYDFEDSEVDNMDDDELAKLMKELGF